MPDDTATDTTSDAAGNASRGPAGDAGAVRVERVAPERTSALRGRVLRPGQPEGAARFPGDADRDAASFAALTPDGTVVGTAVVYPDPCAWRPGARAWRLRGMATEPALRGRGVGAQVLAAALAHARAQGAELVWCNARVPARAFYERAGFAVHGDEWEDPEIGPHVAMAVDLAGPGPAGAAGGPGAEPAGPVG